MPGIIGHDPESPVTFERNTPPGLALHLSFAGLSCPIFFGGADASQAECHAQN
jgi:hypothetical protein